MKWLRTVVGESIPLFSIVVFSERCELKKVTVSSNTVWVIKRDHTYATVRKIWDRSPDVLDIALIGRIYEQLSEMCTAKKGTNAGKQFYGCSAFPKCRYTEQIG